MNKKINNLAQIASVRRYTITDGRAKGLEVIDCDNGKIRFLLNVTKALDVMQLYHEGTNISFLSKNAYTAREVNFLNRFEGGMVYTCGLDNAGGRDGYELHGRLHNTPAEIVSAKCDENGNINNWWTEDDFKRFEAKVNQMIEQFDGIELPWGKVNGAFIVSENMADNGGVAVALDIMGRTEGASYEEYFYNWARVWCQKAKPEFSQMLLAVDVHGPCMLRANIPPRNFDEWYTTFGVTENDKMYIAPEKRIVIW